MRKQPFTSAEGFWRFYCETPLNDFFRGLRRILEGEWETADHCLWIADMTPIVYSCEGLDDAQRAKLWDLDPTTGIADALS